MEYAESSDQLVWEMAAEELPPAIAMLQALPKKSDVRIDVIKSKPKKKPKPPKYTSTGLVKMAIPGRLSEAIEDPLSRSDDRQSLKEYIEALTGGDPTHIANYMRPKHPGWPDDWLVNRAKCDSLFRWPMMWYEMANARRALTDDPAELALILQMQVRQEILANQDGERDSTAICVLAALAIRDELAIDRYLQISTFPSTRNTDNAKFYNGIHAILRADSDELKILNSASMPKSTPQWFKHLFACLQSIAVRDASGFADSLQQHLKSHNQGHAQYPLQQLISVRAHSVYRLAERIDPKLVREVDTRADLPWDQAFHELTETYKKPPLSLEHLVPAPKNWPIRI